MDHLRVNKIHKIKLQWAAYVPSGNEFIDSKKIWKYSSNIYKFENVLMAVALIYKSQNIDYVEKYMPAYMNTCMHTYFKMSYFN